jgi:alpha-glucosidase (family GH31 glycosyl hydrolase)
MSQYKVYKNTITYKSVRISIISDKLLRIEYSKNKKFVDEKTLMVVNRGYRECNFRCELKDDFLYVYTNSLVLETSGEDFSPSSLSILLKNALNITQNIWRYGDKIENLGGTTRTLDEVDGECELDDGLFSTSGYAVLDDSSSNLLVDDFIKPREKGNKDIYYFGYGNNYRLGLKDYYFISGKTPMIPRYALGNWWSRYYKYTSESYLALMDKFSENNIPLSVSVIDMDWHLVDIDPRFGTGWSGYTWNKELFPNPKEFLDQLHKRGLKVSLNDHPSDGLRAFETNYAELAKSVGIDPSSAQTILFDAGDKGFLDKFQEKILTPLENDGVDFWWIDWQQGKSSKIEGLDPLVSLNLTRFEANKKNSNRALIFSRYGGPGSHRYPIGFSGDTIISWESLAFQPKFTIASTNIGYGWWSHDIGGHMRGYKDDELEIRWYQYGVFSPINRLHCSNSLFTSKEPWRYERETNRIMSDFLRLRHKLIPYLYTMNYLSYSEDMPLIRPMYYYNEDDERAYEAEGQYYFGTSMIVSPIVNKMNKNLLMGKAKVYLPKGNYYDLFSSRYYSGDRVINMFRDIETLPVLVKEGNIIVLSDEERAYRNPSEFSIRVFMGDNNQFTLYEDDGISDSYKDNDFVKTLFINDWDNREFIIKKAEGNLSLIPQKRDYKIVFVGISNSEINVMCNDKKCNHCGFYDETKMELGVILKDISVEDTICVKFSEYSHLVNRSIDDDLFALLDRAQIEIELKDVIYKRVSNKNITQAISALNSLDLDRDLFDSICEILLAS